MNIKIPKVKTPKIGFPKLDVPPEVKNFCIWMGALGCFAIAVAMIYFFTVKPL
ncbi:MAG: hypothetical protein LBU68_02990 [Rickettsiales bacterium]|jgi:hypothetical protein|nr:hypothetical protein [Rickettsiales bacterium]